MSLISRREHFQRPFIQNMKISEKLVSKRLFIGFSNFQQTLTETLPKEMNDYEWAEVFFLLKLMLAGLILNELCQRT